ncbi:MAG TPA: hypothetical protein VF384_19065 [Planctomycetota bacterium]
MLLDVPNRGWGQAATTLCEGVTDDTGTCQVSTKDQRIVVRATKEGFVPRATEPVEPCPGERIVVGLVAETRTRILVRDAATHQPVPEARVFAQPSTFSAVVNRFPQPTPTVTTVVAREVARTNREGIAELCGVEAGIHDIAVVAQGMQAADLQGVEIPLATSPLIVDLVAGHELDVVLVDEQDRPKEAWDVQFRRTGRTWVVRTDDRGIARSPGFAAQDKVTILVPRHDLDLASMLAEALLRPTKAEVTVPHPEPVRLVVVQGHANPFRVVWSPGSATDLLDIEVLQEMTPKGHGLSQRTSVPACAGAADLGAATSGNRGRFVVQAVGTESGLWRSEPFFVTTPGLVVTMREVVLRSGLLGGRVLGADGEPIAGARVRLSATAEAIGRLEPTFEPSKVVTPQRETTARGDGWFCCDRLLPGRHLVEASADDGRVTAQLVQITEGTEIELVMLHGGRIRGTVRNLAVPSDARVVVSCPERSWSRTLAVDVEGGFLVTGLAAGSYAVALARPANAPPLHSMGGPGTGIETLVRVDAGMEATCTLDAHTVRRQLHVTVSDCPPALPCEVQIERLNAFDRNGKQVWRVRRPLPRTGSLRFDDLDPAADYVVSLRRVSEPNLLGWIEVPRGVDRATLRADPGVEVTVADVPAAPDLLLVPISGAGVLARDSLLRGTREGDRTLVFAAVPRGAYRLVAVDQRDYCGSFSQSMLVHVGASAASLAWHPVK